MARTNDGAWFRDAFDAMDAFVLIKDERSRIRWANRAFCAYYGLSPDALEALIDGDHSDPDDTLQYVRDDRHVFTTGESLTVVEPITKHDGSVAHYRTTKSPFVHEGTCVGTIGVSVPIDDRELVEHSEGERRKRKVALDWTRTFFRTLPIPAALVDAQGRLFVHSAAFEDLELGEVLGRRLTEVFSGSLGAVSDLADRVVRQGCAERINDAVHKDRHFDVLLQPWHFDEGATSGTFVLFSDVSELRASERELARANEQLREANESVQRSEAALAERNRELESLIDSLSAGVVVADHEGHVVLQNEAAKRLLGPNYGAALGPTFFDERGELLPSQEDPLARAVRGLAVKEQVLRVDAEERSKWVAMSSAQVPESTRFRASSTFFDVSDRVRVQRELEEFAYVAAHDLQEPLRMVSSYIALLDEEYGAELEGDATTYFRFVHEGATRMTRLVRDLLQFSRVGAAPMEMKRVSLAEVVQDALVHAKNRDVDLSPLRTSEGLPTLVADRKQLAALLAELIDNGLKFRAPGREAEVELRAREANGYVLIEVEDNGIGFDMQYASKIFRIFHRLHAKGQYAGTGIGLALCKRIAERHGGTLGVRSTTDVGSVFTLSVPKDGCPPNGTPHER